MAKKHSPLSKFNPSAPTTSSVTVVTGEVVPPSITFPDGSTHFLGKGLWGIVGKNSRYSVVTQFSGLEYVRYEYRRIPEEFRDAAFVSTFLEVVEIMDSPEPLPAAEEAHEAFRAEETPVDSNPAEDETAEG